MQAVAKSVLWKEWLGSTLTGFDRCRFDNVEIGNWRYPLSSVPVEVLPFGFDRPAVNRFHGVRLRRGRNPEASRETNRQRADRNENDCTAPSSLPDRMMSPQLHFAATRRLCLAGLYNMGPRSHPCHVGNRPRSWIPNPGRWLRAHVAHSGTASSLPHSASHRVCVPNAPP